MSDPIDPYVAARTSRGPWWICPECGKVNAILKPCCAKCSWRQRAETEDELDAARAEVRRRAKARKGGKR